MQSKQQTDYAKRLASSGEDVPSSPENIIQKRNSKASSKAENKLSYNRFFNSVSKETEETEHLDEIDADGIMASGVADGDTTLLTEKINEDLSFCSIIPNADINKLFSFVEEFKQSTDHQLAELFAQLERLEKLITSKLAHVCEENMAEENIFELLPLTSVQSVKCYENKLKNKELREKTIIYLKRVIGSGQPWKQAAYKLSSVLFTKELLTHYSWTGVTQTKNENKEAFCKLVNILDIFFHVIFFADHNFTHIQKEIFFKDGILKHSLSRLNSKKRMTNRGDAANDENHNETDNDENDIEGDDNAGKNIEEDYS